MKISQIWTKRKTAKQIKSTLPFCVDGAIRANYCLDFSDNLPYEKVGKNEPVCIADEVPFDIPESWEWVTLKQIAVTALGKTLDKSKNIGEYRPYLCSINVYWTGIDLSTVKQARFEDSELSKYQLNKGDLLICEGGDVGRSAVWDRDEEMYYQNALHRVRFYGNIEPRFFQLLMESYKGAKILDNYSKGMTIKHLVQNSLNSIYFPLPPLAEQRRIVEKIKQLTPYLKKYGSVETTLSNLNLAFPDDLKKSILQYAVQGKLVPQDPADEPASVLLERIRTKKEKLIKAGKIKRDKHESVIFRRDNSYYEKVDEIERCIDDEIPFEIPENWEWVRFFSIVEIATNLVSPERYFDYMHIAPDNIEKSTGTLLECRTVAQDKVSSPNHLFFKGQILYSKIRPLLRKAVIAPFDGLCSADMYPLKTPLNKEYLLRYILSDSFNAQVATAMSSRVKMPKINQAELSKVLIPVPPIQEQERIVNKIKKLYMALV